MTDCRLVMITWLDSRQTDGAWEWLSKYERLNPVEVVSVGWLIQDDDNVKVLAQSMAPDGENMQTAGRKAIPTCCIRSIETLVEAEPDGPPKANEALKNLMASTPPWKTN